jgi:alpha-L-rhamnosidase
MPSFGFSVGKLRCEYLVDPLGIDECAPRLCWLLEGHRRGLRQTAYRVLVSSTREKLARGEGDRWDSGKVGSDRNVHIVYEGRPLSSRDECFWTVELWDEQGESLRSQPARWTMGLLERDDWTAKWIAGSSEVISRDPEAKASTLTQCATPILFRRNFSIDSAIRKATLFASARGLVELRIDGQRVGNDQFVPEWTDYDKRIHYRTYEVGSLLHPGMNTLGAILGDGWYSGYVGWQETRGRYGVENSLLVQLEVELEDGHRFTVTSDSSWFCNTGALLSSDFMMGEAYDARREEDGWDLPEFTPSRWLPAKNVEAPRARLVAQRSEPVRVTETLTALSITKAGPDAYICNFGQNISGWVRLKVSGRSGQTITLRHGERLNPDGTLYTENLRRARATDVVILKGRGLEEWQPRFTFHGFQYVEISGLGHAPSIAELCACVVHSATPPAGSFECSHPGVNRLWLNGCWSQRDNFLSVPTDCPQRDERLGWMGDAQVFLRTATYNMDVAAFFTKWMIDVEDAQTPDGIFPDTAPRLREGLNFVGLDGLGGAAGWADAGVIVPYTIWRMYGDTRIVERHWKAMAAWLAYLERGNPDGHRVHELANNYGDWLCIPSDTSFRTQSPMKNLLATAYWADDAAKMARMARALGRDEEARRYQAMFEKVRAAFQKNYVLKDGRLTVETQTAYLLALAMDLLPGDMREKTTTHLVANIRKLDWHLSTGFIGISHLNPTLTLSGHADVAYRLLLKEDYPSWLYPVLHGATTIWERWNGWTEKEGFFDPSMNSFNHYSLGSVGEWLYRHVAGIELDPDVPGFKRFVLRPFVRAGLDYARAGYHSIQGEIFSSWKRQGSHLHWEVRVPAGTTAIAHIPCMQGASPLESGMPLAEARGLRLLERNSEFVPVELSSGSFSFSSQLS